MKTFVISLPGASRREDIARRLDAVGVSWAFVDGVVGAEARRTDPRLSASPLSDGELGCYLSHVKAWQTVLDHDAQASLILEDDAVIGPEFDAVMTALDSVLPACDLVRLSSLRRQVGWDLGPLGARCRLALPTKNPSGTQAYVLTRRGGQRMLQSCAHTVPLQPIDTLLDEHWRWAWQSLIVVPPVVWEDRAMPSTIAMQGRLARSTRLPLLAKVWRSLRKRAALLGLYREVRRCLPGTRLMPRSIRHDFKQAPRQRQGSES